MKSLYDFIVKPLGDTYENKKTIGDKELILNTKIESFKFVMFLEPFIACKV